MIEKAKILLKQRKYQFIFLATSIIYFLLSLLLIWYFYVGFRNFFSTGMLAYATLSVTLLITLLFGLNVVFVTHTFSNLKRYANQAGMGIFSAVVGFFVAGCPACSLTLLSLIIPYVGAAISLPLFPLKGLEIQLGGLAIIFISLFFTSRNLECKR